LRDWQQNRNADLVDGITNDIPDSTTDPEEPTDSEFYSVSLSYDFAEDPKVILEDPYQALRDYCSWSRVGYHECDHDEADPTPCFWNDVLEHGNIPTHIPDL
jgi:hypothetical protein